jgi:hypothetical protein
MGRLAAHIRACFWQFSAEAQWQRRQQAMHAYLSQASDQRELEWLEQQWDRYHRYSYHGIKAVH